MLKKFQQKLVKVGCLACNSNGSLNSYDSYSCPICQGGGVVEVLAFEEEVLPKGVSNAEILTQVQELIPKTGSVADGYEFCVERL